MRIASLLLAALLAVAGAYPIEAAAKHDADLSKVAASGEPLTLGDIFFVGKGCAVGGNVYIRELKGPSHGKFSNVPAMVYPNLPASDRYHDCNKQLIHGYNQIYVSTPGYTGPDAVSFTVIWSNGDSQKVRISIAVK